MKLSDARKDHYRKLAKENMYRSRSVYKLFQINKSHHILKEGMKVVDIGTAWRMATDYLKNNWFKGTIIGIDLKEIESNSKCYYNCWKY